MAASDAAPTTTRRLFIKDRVTRRYFLVDTGAEVSVFPTNKKFKNIRPAYHLYAANGSKIAAYGERMQKIDLGLDRKYTWIFIEADVTTPILGADFLSKFGILPDLQNKRIVDAKTYYKSNCRMLPASDSVLALSVKPMESEFKQRLDE